jgi:hypothetical protein
MSAPADHRDVPLEVLREAVRSLAEASSLRAVAEDAGVGRSTVHTFASGRTIPHPRVRRRLSLWYLRRVDGLDELELLRPYVAALDVLLADATDPVREDVTLDLLRAMENRYSGAGLDAPRWVTIMRARITRARPLV